MVNNKVKMIINMITNKMINTDEKISSKRRKMLYILHTSNTYITNREEYINLDIHINK